jgi:hypothetical protein
MLFIKVELINGSSGSRMNLFKSQITKLKSQINPNDQNSKSQTFCTLNIGLRRAQSCRILNLPFDLSQGGELVEPFVIWVL